MSEHAGALFFTSPRTGEDFETQYSRVAFEADLPRIEIAPAFQKCNRTTGVNCTLIPITDDGTPADFYPFYSIGQRGGQCMWTLASDIPGFTTNDFGKNAQFGSLLSLEYLAPSRATAQRFTGSTTSGASCPTPARPAMIKTRRAEAVTASK